MWEIVFSFLLCLFIYLPLSTMSRPESTLKSETESTWEWWQGVDLSRIQNGIEVSAQNRDVKGRGQWTGHTGRNGGISRRQ